ncbi:MAG: hypothetical protein HOV66_10505 [Streptomycetaceae bacterium]|nr:hypothetical protein [Streptomycetaceae bacterium]
MYTDDRVRWFVRRADERIAADPDTEKSGLFNGNVAVSDPDLGEKVNVRRPLPVGEREPFAWRTCYQEGEIYQALAQRFTNIPVTYYAAADGSVLLQRYETDVGRLPPSGTALPDRIADEMVDIWHRLQSIPLREPSGLMPPDFVRYLASQDPNASVAVPQTADEYRRLHLAEMEATVGLLHLRWDGLLPALGLTLDPAAPARDAVSRMRDGSLRPAYPDMHRSNVGIKNGHAFLWDPELVGWHDPHDALATCVEWGLSPADQRQRMVHRAQTIASPEVAANLRWNVPHWETFRKMFLPLKQTVRLASRCAHMNRSEALRHIEQSSLYMTVRINRAREILGTGEMARDRFVETCEAKILPAVEQRRVLGVAALGMGPLWSAPSVFDVPHGWAERRNPQPSHATEPRANGYGLTRTAALRPGGARD